MSQISLKSLSGITSITTPAGVDNVFSIHKNDTTEVFRIDQSGNQNISGIITATTFYGSGANLTSLPSQVTISNNADNRVITGGSGTNLNGESGVIIDSSGNLGIGAGTPRQKLHVGVSDSGSANMVFTNSTTGNSAGDGFIVGITGAEDAQLNMQESANLKFSTADTERLRITSGGLIGIGLTNPDVLLHVQNASVTDTKIIIESTGTNSYPAFRVKNDARAYDLGIDGATDALRFYDVTGTAERLRITSAGKVGINSTSPTYALEVDGGTQNTVIVARSSDAKAAISFLDNTTGGYGRATIGAEGTEVYITSGTGGNERLRIDSAGQVLPGADDAQNLGSSTKRWANIYTADMHFSNQGKINDVDGTWGDWTLQEGEDSVFMINNRTGKKYAITMKEVN